ncbi:MAG: hypothetical protein SCARUB_00110 [Candidatus Scalindua rubra]|uniref:Uncharacterized protein n=1 Tax=Candidatus Scalindua rubra TaxID=1872076 RepID=A0A1E3XGX5_9BACT|nr:MAG: hypothetical protein SCARUB_00110 [Candidatus Scalindua rubra]
MGHTSDNFLWAWRVKRIRRKDSIIVNSTGLVHKKNDIEIPIHKSILLKDRYRLLHRKEY